MDDIATNSSITRGAIYWHFKDKTELYNALLIERFATANKTFLELLNLKLTPFDKLRKMFVTMLEMVESDESYRNALEITLFKTEIVPELQPFIQQKNKNSQQFQDTIETIIETGKQQKQFHQNLDTKTAALVYSSTFNGIISNWLMNPSQFSLKLSAPKIIDLILSSWIF